MNYLVFIFLIFSFQLFCDKIDNGMSEIIYNDSTCINFDKVKIDCWDSINCPNIDGSPTDVYYDFIHSPNGECLLPAILKIIMTHQNVF